MYTSWNSSAFWAHQDRIYKTDDYNIQSSKHIYTSWNSSAFWMYQDRIYKTDDYNMQSCKHIYTSWNSSAFWVHQQHWHGMGDRERLGWVKQTITNMSSRLYNIS